MKPQCAQHLAFVPLRNKAAALGWHEHTSPAHPNGMSSSVPPADGCAHFTSGSFLRHAADIRKDAMLIVRDEWLCLIAICLVKACFVET